MTSGWETWCQWQWELWLCKLCWEHEKNGNQFWLSQLV